MSKNQILPQKETKMCSSNHSLPMMLRDFWIPPSASFIAPLLWLTSIFLQILFFQIFGPTKNGHNFFRTKQCPPAPAKKKNGRTKKSPPPPLGAPRLHWHLRYWCQWGFRIWPQEFSGMTWRKMPFLKLMACPWKYVFFPKGSRIFFLCQHFFSGAFAVSFRECIYHQYYLTNLDAKIG